MPTASSWNPDLSVACLPGPKSLSGRAGSIIPPEEVDDMLKPKTKKKSKKVSEDDFNFEPIVHKPKSAWSACHETHPPLPIKVDGKSFMVYGGSCIRPVVTDMDVFVGFDSGMARTSRQFPWNQGCEFLFPIQDMSVPKDLEGFKSMIAFLKDSILKGQKVFMGCIGGHGRTGLVMAALVKELMGEEDAITYVRKNYCSKAVESASQVTWLHTHFGITKVEGTKHSKAPSKAFDYKAPSYIPKDYGFKSDEYMVHPVKVAGDVHGVNKVVKKS